MSETQDEGVSETENARTAKAIMRYMEYGGPRPVGVRPDFFDAVRQMAAWWTSETDEFRQLVGSILGCLPGGDVAAELFSDRVYVVNVGWKEADLLGHLLVSIQDADDVEIALRVLIPEAYRADEDDDAGYMTPGDDPTMPGGGPPVYHGPEEKYGG